MSLAIKLDTTETNTENKAMITSTSLNHPTIQKRIKRSIWLATMQAVKTGERATEYVSNRKGNKVLRVDVLADGRVICYASGRGNKQIQLNVRN